MRSQVVTFLIVGSSVHGLDDIKQLNHLATQLGLRLDLSYMYVPWFLSARTLGELKSLTNTGSLASKFLSLAW